METPPNEQPCHLRLARAEPVDANASVERRQQNAAALLPQREPTSTGRAIGRLLQSEHMPVPLALAVIAIGVLAVGIFILWLVSLVSTLAAETLGLMSAIVIILTLAPLVEAMSTTTDGQ
jgi:hypothetical protein